MATNRELSTEIHRYQVAQSLFDLGARVPVVGEITALSPWLLRKFHFDATGEKPHRGPIPSSQEWYLINTNHLQASLFLQYFLNVEEGIQHRQTHPLVLAYQLWQEAWAVTGLKKTLSFDRAWWLIKLIKSGLMKSQSCRVCRAVFLVGDKRRGTYRCHRCAKQTLSYGPRASRYLPPREKSSSSVSGIA